MQDDRGTRQVEVKTGDFLESSPVPWHEFTNVGDTTLSYLVVEKRYQPPAGGAGQSSGN